MRAPGFWATAPERPSVRARLLSPLGWVYGAATAWRLARGRRERIGVPVICVGNLTAGGTGKTPVVIWLLQHFAARGVDAHVVSRGYGGSLTGPVKVDPNGHLAGQVGDEPLLIAAFGPVWVARDRAAGAQAAAQAGAQVVILDDGFQNPALAHDLSLVVVDAQARFGNGRMIPAGPLREPVAVGMARAGACILIGHDADRAAALSDIGQCLAQPVIGARLEPLNMGIDWAGQPVIAFAGIGRPEKFFATLRGLGADLRGAVALSDHQPLTGALLSRMAIEAKAKGAQLVTTEKDAVRVPKAWRQDVMTLPVRLEPETPSDLAALVDAIV